MSLTILNSSSIVSPVLSLILPNQLVFGLPLVGAPGVVPWIKQMVLTFKSNSAIVFTLTVPVQTVDREGG